MESNNPLERFAQQLEGSLDPDGVLAAIVEAAVKSLRPRYAAIHLNRQDAETLVLFAYGRGGGDGTTQAPSPGTNLTADPAEAGGQATWQLSFPLIHQSEVVGQLVVVPDEGRLLTPQDQHLLATIARRGGWAAHVVRQAHDLRLARERLVLAREEERRRLRRNLHDTIGPTLAALSLKAGAVRSIIERDPEAAQQEMNELRKQIQSVITDIRRLAYDLRPPALDELGMLPAILEQARQFSSGRLQVIVDAPDQLPALPAALEVAVYRIVMEALTNVQRHSKARHCRIRLSADDPILVEVTDDGVGLPAEFRAGIGTASMRERASELGGFCTVESLPRRGTRVLASLPLGSRGQRREAPSGGPFPAYSASDLDP
jgi:signal transduction histidine kinase